MNLRKSICLGIKFEILEEVLTQICYHLQVLVRMKQYKDDLLAACLTFILTLPKEIVSEQMPSVVPAIQVTLLLISRENKQLMITVFSKFYMTFCSSFQLTLSIGLGYLPLAMIALDALDYWSDTLPASVIRPYYPQILPCLDSYLKTMDQGC